MLFQERPKTKSTILQIRMLQDEKDTLKELAKKYNMTVTDFIKMAINKYAKELEQQEK